MKRFRKYTWTLCTSMAKQQKDNPKISKRDDFGFLIIFPWLSGDFSRLPSYGIYISPLV